MKIKIFDYKGDEKIVSLKNNTPISLITVKEISGDEVVSIYYNDGSESRFDSSSDRIMSFFYGEYSLSTKESIDEFLKERTVR